MNFERDIFISYAHNDNEVVVGQDKGWITEFHNILKVRLKQLFGKELNIWRDERLTGNELFGPEIEEQLPKSRVMISIISPSYVNSKWCKLELGGFYEAAKENVGISVGNKSRIFKIIKTPVDKELIEEQPENVVKIFHDILDYRFYIVKEEAKGTEDEKFVELAAGVKVEDRIQQEYIGKINDVVQDIAKLIKRLNKEAQETVQKRKIFLAETSYDLLTYRDQIVRELEDKGFQIVPNKNLPVEKSRFESAVKEFIDESDLSVHLISSTNYALIPEGADRSAVVLQNEIAAAKSNDGSFKRLIWIPPPTEDATKDEKSQARQKEYLEALRSNHVYQSGADILEGTREEFKQAIFDTVERMDAEEKAQQARLKAEEENAKKAAASAASSGSVVEVNSEGPKLVYLVCDQRDLDFTRDLENLIYDSQCEVLLPLFDGDQSQLRQAHVDNLKICDALIIYYGAGDYKWANSLKSDLTRLPALGRTKPLLAKAVYLAESHDEKQEEKDKADKDKASFRSGDMPILNGLKGFDAAVFTEFFQKLK